jgi:hypothetical protein
VLFEGAKALATSLNDTAPLLHARSAAETLIDAATSRVPPSVLPTCQDDGSESSR